MRFQRRDGVRRNLTFELYFGVVCVPIVCSCCFVALVSIASPISYLKGTEQKQFMFECRVEQGSFHVPQIIAARGVKQDEIVAAAFSQRGAVVQRPCCRASQSLWVALEETNGTQKRTSAVVAEEPDPRL